MNNNKSFISLKAKIVMSTLIPVIISFSLISAVIFYSLFSSLHETAKSELLQVGQKYAVRFESKISNAMNYLSIVASILEVQAETGTADREALQKQVIKIFDDYGMLDGSSIYFEPDMYDGRDAEYVGSNYGTAMSGRICYYFYINDGKIAYLPEAMENDIEFELPHYTMAKEANKPIYTQPVVYEVGGRDIPMFTITYPVHDNAGAFIGAVTVDLFLEDIYTQLQNEKIYETGYIIIANDNGEIIYSPRFEDIGKTREEAGFDYALPSSGEETVFGDAKSILNGKDAFLALESIYIPQLDSFFYISAAAPTEEINAGGASLMSILIIFSVIIVIVIALLLYYLIGKISAPIKEITESANKIAGGGYDARITGDYTGEFAVVKDSVNTMADSIEAYMERAENSLNILKSILDGLDAFIYVTIPDTGEILFINEHMKEHFNIKSDGVGQLCYKVLQDGMDEMCDFCPCRQLDKEPDKAVVWEERNTVTGRDYRNTDCYIDWIGGIKVHLQHSVDITDIKTYMNDKLEAERMALEMTHQKEKAEMAAQAKNDFLAKMSHEIRTPMNAVMGMSELILRKELPQDVYENALGIKSASANLLSIINDILDFSKIESGMLEIVETGYLFPSLINDVIGIIRIRLLEKPVQFVVNIDPQIPASLIGDEIRVRQTLLNLLSNAVKYTGEGHISLAVTGEVGENTVVLSIDISDSGVGIRDEDIERLFFDFVQIDTATNKGIEGTGLGLAISRNLCQMMGGDIAVRSEYGKGSTFTVTLPQRFEAYEPFASISNPVGKSVLIYETRQVYSDSVIRTLENLGVDYKNVDSIPALFDNLEEYSYVFISSFMYGSINPALSKLDNPPKLILMADVTETIAPRDVRMLSLPAHSLSIANILNDIYEDYGTVQISGASFTAPDARVLVVDDIMANLKVAEGLMSPYEMQINICTSGREAVRLVAENRYDLVFMDHMMPEMDGLEATSRIRAMEGEYFESLPIISLTANAVSGMREMFIQNGMDDFLAKPIETVKLDAILEKWIPKEKRRKRKKVSETIKEKSSFVDTLRNVPELDVKRALNVVGGSDKIYERMVKQSVRLLPENITRLDALIDADLPRYAIEVHGMKSVLNNIGAYELGTTAFELEELSKSGGLEACKKIHSGFIDRLIAFSDSMGALTDKADIPEKPEGDKSLLIEALPKLENAADFFDSALALEILTSVREYAYGDKTDKTMADLTSAFEHFDFDKAMELVAELKGQLETNG